MKIKHPIQIFPFLIACYPVLSLLSQNIEQIKPNLALRPLLFFLGISFFLYLGFWVAMRNREKAGFATSALILALSSYGHIYSGLKQIGLSGTNIVRHRYLLPLIFAITLMFLLWVWRRENVARYSFAFNIVSISLILIPLINIGVFLIESKLYTGSDELEVNNCEALDMTLGEKQTPDIYYIIMDAYARDDILRDLHNFDNSPFLNWLESAGFYIAYGSLSNYPHTELSIASALNLNYIQAYPAQYSVESSNRMGIIDILLNNRLRHDLECLGYISVAFETGVFWTEWLETDYYFSNDQGPFANLNLFGSLTRFEALLFNTTAGRAISDGFILVEHSQRSIPQNRRLREDILFIFDQLTEIPSLPSPKIVFVHILSPHPPMLFDSNGNPVNQGQFETILDKDERDDALLQAYVEQVQFLNSKLQHVVGEILKQSINPPVIIIQGDHGWADRNSEDKMSILNAYYIPGLEDGILYPTITPVNSFRVVFNQYFGAGLELLPDVSYFSYEGALFQFEEVKNTWLMDP